MSSTLPTSLSTNSLGIVNTLNGYSPQQSQPLQPQPLHIHNDGSTSEVTTPITAIERQLSGEPGMFVVAREATQSFGEYSSRDAGCASLTCAHPALEPFPHFVFRVLNIQIDTLLGRIIEQASELYLFRNDPDALRIVMEFWYHYKNFTESNQLPPATPVPRPQSETEKQIFHRRGQSGDALLQIALAANEQQSTMVGEPAFYSSSSANVGQGTSTPIPTATRADVSYENLASNNSGANINSNPNSMGVLQSCIEAYFSTDWHRQQDVMMINRQHREFMKKREWTKYVVEGYKQFREVCTACDGDASVVHRFLTELWHERNSKPPGTPSPAMSPTPSGSPNYPALVSLPEERLWLEFEVVNASTLQQLECDMTRKESLLIVFHAAFSTPSTIFVSSTLAPLRSEIQAKSLPIRIVIVNASVEINLLLEYGVEEFPTVCLHVPPPAAPPPPPPPAHLLLSASASACCAKNAANFVEIKNRRKMFPSNGVLSKNVLLEWILSHGTSVVPERKLKQFVTKLVRLERRLRFAPFRKLHSAANTVRRLCSTSAAAVGCHCTALASHDENRDRGDDDVDDGDEKSSPDFTRRKSSPERVALSKPPSQNQLQQLPQQQQHQHQQQQQQQPNKDPRFIFLGGGAASGKSTAVMALKTSPWWEENKSSIVVVDADEFKRHDPMYKGNSADLHEKSVSAAEFLLVSAVNDGRHIIFDSTMMWAPFVEQTIDMIRDSVNNVYEKGPGWQGENRPEIYWQIKAARPAEERALRRPYTIAIYGIFADPARSVPRCLVRELTSGRTMLVAVLLKSLKLFASHFHHYCDLVDEAVLFDNNVFVDLEKGELPPTAAKKDSKEAPLEILDEHAWKMFLKHRALNPRATRLDDLYEKKSVTSMGTITDSITSVGGIVSGGSSSSSVATTPAAVTGMKKQ